MTSCRVAADIGGTFTDIALALPGGAIATKKVPSTPADYGRAVVEGVTALLAERGLSAATVTEVLHGCTVATNAILENKGARTALLTTRGFRDVLELRRIRVPRLYDPLYVKPEPLAPRDLRLEIGERVGPDGAVILPLDETDVAAAIEVLRAREVEAVAVCFLHSYANPAHERRVGEMLRRALPGCFVSLSVDVLPEIREYERGSTTVINAYVGPPVSRYVDALGRGLKQSGVNGRLLVMQSSGGILDAESVMEFPARIVECGPAAGVIGAARVAARAGHRNVITFDMGGTTAKASIIEEGRILETDEYEVGGGISLSSRLVKGGGYALKLPVIDISEVGAGGGSLVWIDRAGGLKVGPESAGAVPGPACYAMGGERATVTDANVVLGYLNPDALAAGTVPIRADLSRKAIAEQVAKPLGQSVEAAARGVYMVAAATMIRALKAVSTYRGRDPRDFSLVAFGGNGGIFAAELARHLGIRTVIVPPGAGVLSAFGLLWSDTGYSHTNAYFKRSSAADPAEMDRIFRELEAVVRRKLGDAKGVTLTRAASMRYAGQAFELRVPAGTGKVTRASLARLSAAFEDEHERTYGHAFRGEMETELVSLSVAGAIPRRTGSASGRVEASSTAKAAKATTRMAVFGDKAKPQRTAIIGRADLGRRARPGPLVIEDYEGTTLVPPGFAARRDQQDNIVITEAGR